MTDLEEKRTLAEATVKRCGLEIWDQPSMAMLARSPSNVPVQLWTMRLGDPATNKDHFLESTLGEGQLWEESEKFAEIFQSKKRQANA